jgi:two-component system chemotaxis sensor kinase CheA
VSRLRDQLSGGDGNKARIEMGRDEYAQLLAHLDGGADRTVIASFVRSLVEERASTRLARISGQLRSIGRRLGKTDVEIVSHVSPADLRLPAERWARFWTVFVHVLRNTMDHGIETPEERSALGKRGLGVVSLSLVASAGGVEVSIADDGRGIAWEKICARALAIGLPAETAADLEEALFTDSVSSKDVVSHVSGRGVGMGALRDAVRACGGSLSIGSAAGVGTTIRFQFPSSMLSSAPDGRSVAVMAAA